MGWATKYSGLAQSVELKTLNLGMRRFDPFIRRQNVNDT